MKKVISILIVISALMILIGCNATPNDATQDDTTQDDTTQDDKDVYGTWEGSNFKVVIDETTKKITMSRKVGEDWKVFSEGDAVVDKEKGKINITATKIVGKDKELHDLPYKFERNWNMVEVSVTISSVKTEITYSVKGDEMIFGCYKGGSTETLIGDWTGGVKIVADGKFTISSLNKTGELEGVTINDYGYVITNGKMTHQKKASNMASAITTPDMTPKDNNETADWTMKSAEDKTITLSNTQKGSIDTFGIEDFVPIMISLKDGDMKYTTLGDYMIIHETDVDPILKKKAE